MNVRRWILVLLVPLMVPAVFVSVPYVAVSPARGEELPELIPMENQRGSRDGSDTPSAPGGVDPSIEGRDSPPPLRILRPGEDVPDRDQQAPPPPEQEDARSINRILAVVANSPVTMKHYRDRFGDTDLRIPRLRQLIEARMIQQRAREMGVLLDKQRVEGFVDDRIDSMVAQNGPDAFEQYLRSRGWTRGEYRVRLRNKIRDQMLRGRVIARSYPDVQNSDTSPAYRQIRARMILVGDSTTAWDVYENLSDSPTETTWNRMFEQHSKKLSFMGPHGDLGWFQWGHYGRRIEYEIYRLPEYGFSEPFRVKGQHALVYRTGTRSIPNAAGDTGTVIRTEKQLRASFYEDILLRDLRRRYSVVVPGSVRGQLDVGGGLL